METKWNVERKKEREKKKCNPLDEFVNEGHEILHDFPRIRKVSHKCHRHKKLLLNVCDADHLPKELRRALKELFHLNTPFDLMELFHFIQCLQKLSK